MRKYEDLTGQKFGRLTVIKYAYSKKGARYWLCECSCGNKEKYVTTGHLKNGRISLERYTEILQELEGKSIEEEMSDADRKEHQSLIDEAWSKLET